MDTGGCTVTYVSPDGCVAKHNEKLPFSQQLHEGCTIVAIAGARACSEIHDKLKNAKDGDKLKMTLRPRQALDKVAERELAEKMKTAPDVLTHACHTHSLRKLPDVHGGRYECNICHQAGEGWVYHCDTCGSDDRGWDAHPKCVGAIVEAADTPRPCDSKAMGGNNAVVRANDEAVAPEWLRQLLTDAQLERHLPAAATWLYKNDVLQSEIGRAIEDLMDNLQLSKYARRRLYTALSNSAPAQPGPLPGAIPKVLAARLRQGVALDREVGFEGLREFIGVCGAKADEVELGEKLLSATVNDLATNTSFSSGNKRRLPEFLEYIRNGSLSRTRYTKMAEPRLAKACPTFVSRARGKTAKGIPSTTSPSVSPSQQQDHTPSQQVISEGQVLREHQSEIIHQQVGRIEQLRTEITSCQERLRLAEGDQKRLQHQDQTIRQLQDDLSAGGQDQTIKQLQAEIATLQRALEQASDTSLAASIGSQEEQTMTQMRLVEKKARGDVGNMSLKERIRAIERRGHVNIDEGTGRVKLLKPFLFLSRNANEEPAAAFEEPDVASQTCKDLAELSSLLNYRMRIEGHTEAAKDGTAVFWQTLADNRARLVSELMMNSGAQTNMITTVGLPGTAGLNERRVVVYFDIAEAAAALGQRDVIF
jgi:outer membrane protein OmpA-like peptidoglycan-associated protein